MHLDEAAEVTAEAVARTITVGDGPIARRQLLVLRQRGVKGAVGADVDALEPGVQIEVEEATSVLPICCQVGVFVRTGAVSEDEVARLVIRN